MCRLCFLLLCLTLSLYPADSSRILAVFPVASKSHFLVFQPLLLELVSRGHNVTVLSNFPLSTPLDNYTDIDVRGFKNVYTNDLDLNFFSALPVSFGTSIYYLYFEVADFEMVFSHPRVRGLLASQESFDLVLTETWVTDVLLGFGHQFHVPVVAMTSCEMYTWHLGRFGSPENPAYISTYFTAAADKMKFWERFVNSYHLVVSKLVHRFFYNPLSEKIARNSFGESFPTLGELAKNTALILVNTHHTIYGSRPVSPQVVEIGGIHVTTPKPLPKELDTWMNDSSHGVVYMSFGSILKGSTLPKEKIEAFLKVFGSLRQRVLWKFEDDFERALPHNVRVMKWLPQRDVLAHPKTRVFISHSGLLGVLEAVVSAVPILGIPMFADQPHNVAALVERGVAVHVDYNNISVASLSYALDALLHDPGYRERARQLSTRFLDRPQSAMDTAVYWVEYVLRHGGAPHLRSAAVHLAWYQYYLLDVAALCLLALATILTTLYYLTKACCSLLRSTSNTKLKAN